MRNDLRHIVVAGDGPLGVAMCGKRWVSGDQERPDRGHRCEWKFIPTSAKGKS